MIVSEDAASEPKQIRFAEEFETVDVTNLSECITRQESFPVGTHVISLGNIAQAKLLSIKPKASTVSGTVTMSINGSLTEIPLRAGKVSRLWTTFTSLSITVTGNPVEMLIVIAGD